MAFVTQEPWIQHGTIRENILFGKPYDAGKYRIVLEVCALNAESQCGIPRTESQ